MKISIILVLALIEKFINCQEITPEEDEKITRVLICSSVLELKISKDKAEIENLIKNYANFNETQIYEKIRGAMLLKCYNLMTPIISQNVFLEYKNYKVSY